MEDTGNAEQACERVTVALVPEAAAALRTLTGPGRTKTSAINRALVRDAFLEEQAAAGGTVLIRQRDGTTVEVRFL